MARHESNFDIRATRFDHLAQDLCYGLPQKQVDALEEETLHMMGERKPEVEAEPTYYLTGENSPFSTKPDISPTEQVRRLAKGLLGTEQTLYEPVIREQEQPVVAETIPEEKKKNPWEEYFEGRERTDPVHFLAEFKALTNFYEYPETGLQVLRDVIGFKRFRNDGTIEGYEQKLEEEVKKGQTEAASFGIAKIGHQKFVFAATHWGFMRGSMGSAVGEELVMAMELAQREKLPLVALHSSAGVRQQENTAGLMQMPKLADELQEFEEQLAERNIPYISILCECFGGLSASIATGDITIGVKGTRYGFAGPEPIQEYQGPTKPPVTWADQSVERHLAEGNIDLLVDNPKDLQERLRVLFALLRNKKRNNEKTKTTIPPIAEGKIIRHIPEPGFYAPDQLVRLNTIEPIVDEAPVRERTLFQTSEALNFDPNRPEFQDILQMGVPDFFPLYMGWKLPNEEHNMLHYPPIAAAIGRLGDQTVMLIGNMPQYYEDAGNVRKLPSSPDVKNIQRMNRLYRLAEKLGLDCVVFCNTPGAKPTLAQEYLGMPFAIQEAMKAGGRFKKRLITVINGKLGSGGGLVTAPRGDRVLITEDSFAGAADLPYMVRIVKKNATQEDKELIASNMRGTAHDQKDLEFADEVIYFPAEGSSRRPVAAVGAICTAVVNASVTLNESSLAHVRRERRKRIRRLRGMPLRHRTTKEEKN